MIQINCTIVNITSAPSLQLDNGHLYLSTLESATRAIFKLNDADHDQLGTFFVDGQVVFASYIVPSSPGSYEGPVLVFRRLVEPLHIERDRFLLPDNTEWKWRGHQDFMLFKRSLDGLNITPLLQQRYAAGSRVVVTLMMAWFIEQFIPANYGQRFFDHIEPFANALEALGFRWMPICFADAQIIMPNSGDQRIFLSQLSSRFSGIYTILPSLANEYQKNGCDPSIFSKPSSNLWSRGSNVGDSEPYRPGWDWKEWHARRDWPKVLFGNDDGWYVKEGIDADGHILDYPMPGISSEPLGFWNQNVPNRRSNDPNLARVIGGTSVYFLRGGNFMSEQGLRCEMWDDITYDCAVHFFNGINQA